MDLTPSHFPQSKLHEFKCVILLSCILTMLMKNILYHNITIPLTLANTTPALMFVGSRLRSTNLNFTLESEVLKD